jgi:hypothetical protein
MSAPPQERLWIALPAQKCHWRFSGCQNRQCDAQVFGGENDTPSRNLSRFLETLAPRLGLDLGF